MERFLGEVPIINGMRQFMKVVSYIINVIFTDQNITIIMLPSFGHNKISQG